MKIPFRASMLTLGVCLFSTTHAAVYCVRPNENDALPGTSWVQAKQTLGNAIAIASGGDEIWVARGTHAERITLKPGLKFYGGFQGTETDLAQPNWATHVTTLCHTNGPAVTVTNAVVVSWPLAGAEGWGCWRPTPCRRSPRPAGHPAALPDQQRQPPVHRAGAGWEQVLSPAQTVKHETGFPSSLRSG